MDTQTKQVLLEILELLRTLSGGAALDCVGTKFMAAMGTT